MTLTPRQIRRRAKRAMINGAKGKTVEERKVLAAFMKTQEFKEWLNNYVASRVAIFGTIQ